MNRNYFLVLLLILLLAGCIGSNNATKGGTSTSTGNPDVYPGDPPIEGIPSTEEPVFSGVLKYDFSNVKALVSPRDRKSEVVLEKITIEDEIKPAVSIIDNDFFYKPEIKKVKKSPDGSFYILYAWSINIAKTNNDIPIFCNLFKISLSNEPQCVDSELESIHNFNFDAEGNIFYVGNILIDSENYIYKYFHRYKSADLSISYDISAMINTDFGGRVNSFYVASNGYYYYHGTDEGQRKFLKVWRYNSQLNQPENIDLTDLVAELNGYYYIVASFFEVSDGSILFSMIPTRNPNTIDQEGSLRKDGIFKLNYDNLENQFTISPYIVDEKIESNCYFSYSGEFTRTSDGEIYLLTGNERFNGLNESYASINLLHVNPDQPSCTNISNKAFTRLLVSEYSDDHFYYYWDRDGDQKSLYIVNLNNQISISKVFSESDYDVTVFNPYGSGYNFSWIGYNNIMEMTARSDSTDEILEIYLDLNSFEISLNKFSFQANPIKVFYKE